MRQKYERLTLLQAEEEPVARIIVHEITQFVFADGAVTLEPGTQFPADTVFPPDVRWREVIIDG